MTPEEYEKLKDDVVQHLLDMEDGDWNTVAIMARECGCEGCSDRVLLDLCQDVLDAADAEGIELEFEENEYDPVGLPYMQVFYKRSM